MTQSKSRIIVGARMSVLSPMRMGQFFSLDVTSGEEVWARPAARLNAVVVALGNRVAFLTDEARLIIVPLGAASVRSYPNANG